jgi:hypothetical protein
MLSQIFDYVEAMKEICPFLATISAASPWYAPKTAVIGSWDCASKLVIIPVKTSPLPAVAKAAFPVVFLYTFRHR